MPKRRFKTLSSSSNSNSNKLNSLDLSTPDINDNRFKNIKEKTIQDIISLIPGFAVKRTLTPVPGAVTEGFEYKWSESGQTWRVRFHGPDHSSPPESNSSKGWIVRVQRGKHYMDSTGEFHSPGIFNKNSPNYNESICNSTHIPIKKD